MTDNPLAGAMKSRGVKRSAQEWRDHGNQMLAGMIPDSNGDFIRRNDVRWVVRDGQPCIEWAAPPRGSIR
jgi:hypothetical protein